MAYSKITGEDLQNKGVIGLADVPALDTADMQAKFEETARGVIVPKFNALVDSLSQRDAQVDTLMSQLAHKDDTYTMEQVDGIAAVKADKNDTYSKAETDSRIDDKIIEIGSADMARAEYATNGAQGVVDTALTAHSATADAMGNVIADTYITAAQDGGADTVLVQAGSRVYPLTGAAQVVTDSETDTRLSAKLAEIGTDISGRMSVSGGAFTGTVQASDSPARHCIRNIRVQSSSLENQSTGYILMVRK